VQVLDRWQQPGDKAPFERYTTGASNTGSLASTAASWASNYGDATRVADASFVRLKNISLSYHLPEKWMQKYHVQHARVYIQGQNLLTFTRYKGLDPENNLSGFTSLPPLKVLTGGIQVTL
jgi:hypothetical protein